MAILNLVCAESNFLTMLEKNHLQVMKSFFKDDELIVSKINSFSNIYAKQHSNKKPFSLFKVLSKHLKNTKNKQGVHLAESYEVPDNEIILFVNPKKELSAKQISLSIKALENNEDQIIIDGLSYKLDCQDCPKKVYWAFVHWMETLQSSVAIGEDATLISFIAIKKNMLTKIVDFQFETESVTYRMVV